MQFKTVLLALAITANVAALPTDSNTAMDNVDDAYDNGVDVRYKEKKKKPYEYVRLPPSQSLQREY